MTDADIRAFGPAPAAPAARPRRNWPWLLGAALVLMLVLTLLAAGAAALSLMSLVDGLRDGAHVLINGEPWNWTGFQTGDGDGWLGFIIATVCLALAGVLVALIVVPCIVLAVLLGGLGVAIAVAAAVGSVGLVLALVLSPLWLFALLLWLVLRRRPQRAAA